jgi:hypothetical protein
VRASSSESDLLQGTEKDGSGPSSGEGRRKDAANRVRYSAQKNLHRPVLVDLWAKSERLLRSCELAERSRAFSSCDVATLENMYSLSLSLPPPPAPAPAPALPPFIFFTAFLPLSRLISGCFVTGGGPGQLNNTRAHVGVCQGLARPFRRLFPMSQCLMAPGALARQSNRPLN